MIKLFGLSLLCFVSVPTSAIASSYVIDIVPEKNQISRYDEGREVIQDDMPGSSARFFEPKDKTPKRAGFRVLVFNGSKAPVNFGPDNITLVLEDGTRVAMITYRQLLAEEHKREVWQGIALAMGNAGRSMAAAQAGNTYGQATYSGQSYGSVGSTPFNANTTGTATYSGYNAGAAYAAQANASAQNNAVIQEFAYSKAAAQAAINSVMQTQTVDPGTSFGGVVQYDMPKLVTQTKAPVPITVEIRVGDDVHIFHGTLTKS